MVSSVLLAQIAAYWVARPDSSYRQRVFIIVPQGQRLPPLLPLPENSAIQQRFFCCRGATGWPLEHR
jgi:hypothetical protein